MSRSVSYSLIPLSLSKFGSLTRREDSREIPIFPKNGLILRGLYLLPWYVASFPVRIDFFRLHRSLLLTFSSLLAPLITDVVLANRAPEGARLATEEAVVHHRPGLAGRVDLRGNDETRLNRYARLCLL